MRTTSAMYGYEPSIHVPLMRQAIEEAHRGGSVPTLTSGMLSQAAQRAHLHSEHFSGDFSAAAAAMVRAAREQVQQRGGRFGFVLLEAEFVGAQSLTAKHRAAMAAWQDPGF